jgi:hypothetical protein
LTSGGNTDKFTADTFHSKPVSPVRDAYREMLRPADHHVTRSALRDFWRRHSRQRHAGIRVVGYVIGARAMMVTMQGVDNERIDAYEAALRRMPEAYSLALRLKDAGVADAVVCSYLHIETEGLETLLLLANRKLAAELHRG